MRQNPQSNLFSQFNQQGFGTLGQQQATQQQPRQFGSIAELNAALAAQRKAQEARKPKPVDKPTRIAEIEHELDICRGIIPTPKGYKVDTSKVKSLVAELKQLQA